MLRTSSYTIFVDLPGDEATVLLVHGYTAAYDRVPRDIAAFLRRLQARNPAKPLYGEWRPEAASPPAAAAPPEATIARLAEQGYLTELSPEEEETFFAGLAVKLHERALARPPAYVLIPTYDCNLRCSYCFQDHMRTDRSFRHLLASMRPAMIDRIFDALRPFEESLGLTPEAVGRRSLGLFGGEPLLAGNRPIVEAILDRTFALGDADVWAVTNGTELGAFRDLLGPAGIARLQITIDGPPAQHDQRRIYADGAGSYERIAANLDLALARGVLVSVRINVDRHNLDGLPAVADAFSARGWDRHPGFSAYAAPVHPGNGKVASASTFSSWDLDHALTAMRHLHPGLAVLARPDEAMRSRARRLFDQQSDLLPCLRPSFCGAHDRMYIFDPFGDIYACWERTGDPKVRVGRVTPESRVELDAGQVQLWHGRTVASNPVCRRCRYALHCGGGCAVLALGRNGSLASNYCDGFAARFRASVAEAYLASLSGATPAAWSDRVCDL
jgi:uncharacterized protein